MMSTMSKALAGAVDAEPEVLGYTVEKVTADVGESHAVAYVLTGARGARYYLKRSNPQGSVYYVTHASNGHICGLKGNYWFTDSGGRLITHNGERRIEGEG